MQKILIIEDNKNLAFFIQKYLQKKEFEVNLSFDGVNALKAFANEKYDLLLVDIKIPLMDGETVCKKIRASNIGKEIPIIMMSGFFKDPTEIAKLKKELRLSGFLNKPFPFDEFLSLIKSSLLPERAELPSSSQTATARNINKKPPSIKQEVTSLTTKPFKGRFEENPFDKILSFIHQKKITGTLLAGKEMRKKKFFFLGGSPIEVDVSSEDDDFGNYLMHKDIISMAELRAYEDSKGSNKPDPRDIFIKMGALSRDQFATESRSYLKDNLIDCFSWRSGLYLFEPKPPGITVPYSARVEMPYIIHEGFKKHLSPSRVSSFMEKKGKLYLSRSNNFYNLQNHISGEAIFETVSDLLEGNHTVTGIINAVDIENESALSIIYILDYLSMINFSASPHKSEAVPSFPIREPIPIQQEEKTIVLQEEFEDLGEELNLLADELEGLENEETTKVASDSVGKDEEELRKEWKRIEGKNYYEIFNLTQSNYSFNGLKKAYFDLTKKFSPEKFIACSGDILTLSEEFLSKISTAYNTLSNVVEKENYDELIESSDSITKGAGKEEKKFQAQIQFQSGKVFLEDGEYESAEKSFMNCINIFSKKPEYYSYLALAIYNNPANRGNITSVAKTKELVNKSLKLGKLSIAYALKGSILLDEGNLSLAEAELNKALKINPANKTAIKKLEIIAEKREQDKKGLFSRIFK